jgi:L-asparaginase
MNRKKNQKIVVLATGGTIAGVAQDISKPFSYVSGQLSVNQLTQRLDPRGITLVQEQVSNIDSKDMQFTHWQALIQRCHYWLNQDDVLGLVVTHGTDTLEETAFFLQAVLTPTKPLAITCAMFPANVPQSDGPENLQDSLDWVLETPCTGVYLVCANEVHFGIGVQKIYSDRSNAFISRNEESLVATTVASQLGWTMPSVNQVLNTKRWPRVELLYNHTGADGQLVRNLLQANTPALSQANPSSTDSQDSPLEGLVVAGTGSGTLSQDLETALLEASQSGVMVARTSRCAFGHADQDTHPEIAALHHLSPVQGRVAMILGLIALRAR